MAARLSDLRSRRAAVLDGLRKLVEDAEAAGRDFDDGEAARYEELRGQERQLAAQIERREALDSLERGAAAGAAGDGEASEWRSLTGRWSLFRAVGALIGTAGVDGGVEREVSAEIQRRRGGKAPRGIFMPSEATAVRAADLPLEHRASAYAVGAGHTLVPTAYRPDQFVDLLQPSLITSRLGVRHITVDGAGKVSIPRALSGMALEWIGEDEAGSPQASTYDALTAEPHTGTVLTSISRRMLLTSTPAVESLVRADLARAIAGGIDRAFIRGAGGATDEPAGLLSQVAGAPGNGLTVVTIGTPANGDAWLSKLVELRTAPALYDANAEAGRWLFSSRVAAKLATTPKSTNAGQENLMPLDGGAGTLLGRPVVENNFAPDDLGAGSDLSMAAYADWSDAAMIVQFSGYDLIADPYSSANTGSLRLVAFVDCDIIWRRLASVAVATDFPAS